MLMNHAVKHQVFQINYLDFQINYLD